MEESHDLTWFSKASLAEGLSKDGLGRGWKQGEREAVAVTGDEQAGLGRQQWEWPGPRHTLKVGFASVG